MKTDDFFEALSEIDDELIANARPVRSTDEIVVRRAPLWKTVAGYAAAAACVAALVVGGIFGIKYFNGRNAVTPPASGTSSGDVSYSKSDCMAYAPMEYPPEAKYVYKGDYGELDYLEYVLISIAQYYSSFEELAAASDLIISGEFTDHAHQTSPVDEACKGTEMSYNTFYIKNILKGDKEPGEPIVIGQHSSVHNGEIFSYPMAPMICGDKWIYFLKEADGYYMPVSCVQGRYPLPFNQNKELKKCGDYGYYYGSNCRESDPGTAIYLQTLNEFGLAVTQNFDGVILSVMTDKKSYKQGDEIKVTATVLNTTDKPIGLLMPVQGENSHTEISTRIERAERYLPDISVSGIACDAMDSHIVEPYGGYVQEMTFGTSYRYYEKPEAAMPGIYKGTAAIYLLADPNDTGSETTRREINFELEITGDKNIQPPVETIADYYGEQSPAEGIKFTMPEFPGTEFEYRSGGVFANGEWLFGGYSVYNVYLCDLNGDGKREIISCCHGTNYKLLESDVIKICDYADGGKLYYFADDPFFYDDHLTIKDGSLIVVRTTKPGYSVEPEDIPEPLTFDRLEAYYVRSENAAAPVKNWGRLDDLSRCNGMENSRLFYLEYYCENDNEPVYSTVNGTVYDAGYSPVLGNCIVVIGEDGYSYCFGSMKNVEPFVEIGDKVTVGQQIGIVGSTGDWPYGTVGVSYFCSLGDIIIKHVD